MNDFLEGVNASGKLRAVMAVKNKTQADIAVILGVTRETINNRLEADRWLLNDLKKIASVLEIDEHILTS
ncbi:MAG: helix-turn-helix transcriptional regulator [Chlamydiota bacterium]|nr:helix-turn-helix transcriptional regulator [Chlamydiota bacterium]